MFVKTSQILYLCFLVILCPFFGCDKNGVESESVDTGSVSGRVYSATASVDNSISYSSYARVTLYVRERPCGSRDPAYCDYLATTRPVDGTFTFKNLPAGGYWIIAYPDDYLCGDSQFVEVAADQYTEMDSLIIVEKCGLLLYGKARYDDGAVYAVDTLEFFVSNISGLLSQRVGTVVTSDDGAYAFSFWTNYDYVCYSSPRGSVLLYDTVGYVLDWCSYYDCNCFPAFAGMEKYDPVITAEE